MLNASMRIRIIRLVLYSVFNNIMNISSASRVVCLVKFSFSSNGKYQIRESILFLSATVDKIENKLFICISITYYLFVVIVTNILQEIYCLLKFQ